MDNGSYVLDYTHFSIVMCRSRCLAYFTAVNIDGSQAKNIKRSGDCWNFDPRIPQNAQYGNDLYAKNDLDRGHLEEDWTRSGEIRPRRRMTTHSVLQTVRPSTRT